MTASLDPSPALLAERTGAFAAAKAGTLPHDGSPTVGTVAMPPGHRCRSTRCEAPAQHQVLWATDGPVAAAGRVCAELHRAFPSTGLWPLVLEPLHGADDRPWEQGEFEPGDPARIDGVDVHDTVEEWWGEVVPDPAEADGDVDPFIVRVDRQFPGLAEPTVDGAPVTALAESVDHLLDGLAGDRIGLVPTRRPADVVTVVGWLGAVNNELEMWRLSAILRSWEERFGAYVVGLGADTMELAVARPPTDFGAAVAIAVEHFAVCPDIVRQGVGTIEGHAEQIVNARVWSLWWD